MNANPNEMGSFILPSDPRIGEFHCGLCNSPHLRWQISGGQLILNCEDCGNYKKTNFIAIAEADRDLAPKDGYARTDQGFSGTDPRLLEDQRGSHGAP